MNGHRWLGAALALCALAAPASEAHGQQTPYDGGAPNGGAGWLVADGTHSADDFVLAQTIAFDAIRFSALLPAGATHAPTMFREILGDDAVMPPGNVTTGAAFVTLGRVLVQRGRPAEACRLLDEGHGILRARLGECLTALRRATAAVRNPAGPARGARSRPADPS